MPRLHDIATGELLVFKRIVELAPDTEPDYQKVTVRSGDSLSAIFSRAGISAQETHRVTNADDRVKALRRIYPGDELLFHVDKDGRLQSLRYAMDSVRTLVVERDAEDGFSTRIVEEVLETRVVEASGTIDRSLFVSARRAGLSQRQVMQFMSIFEWQLDFNRDIRQGDTFSIVYEAEFLDDEMVNDGRILAAKLINGSRRHTALRFEQEDGTVGYYGANGENLRKAFIRRPVQNARISSGFDRNRMHPVLGERRPHLGTDFAAPTGTPIMASGAGRVVHVGRKGGYGHTVIIQHNNRYRTLYAHMSRYADGLSNGSRVEQGEVIGYVGRSGLATGPHLHYEFMVEGNHYDPMSIDLPTGEPVPDSQMTAFRQHTAGALAQLQDGAETQLAARGED
nr:peptidoglycan DD-metalloendopeptidase family protein [Methylonatrum kenyense]